MQNLAKTEEHMALYKFIYLLTYIICDLEKT